MDPFFVIVGPEGLYLESWIHDSWNMTNDVHKAHKFHNYADAFRLTLGRFGIGHANVRCALPRPDGTIFVNGVA